MSTSSAVHVRSDLGVGLTVGEAVGWSVHTPQCAGQSARVWMFSGSAPVHLPSASSSLQTCPSVSICVLHGIVGDTDGDALGPAEGDADGDTLGLLLGPKDGDDVGPADGNALGPAEGDADGDADGVPLGPRLGLAEGDALGLFEGAPVTHMLQLRGQASLYAWMLHRAESGAVTDPQNCPYAASRSMSACSQGPSFLAVGDPVGPMLGASVIRIASSTAVW